MTSPYEHWTQTGHGGFRKHCNADSDCDGDVAWETLWNYYCEAHRPWHPFRWRSEVEIRFP